MKTAAKALFSVLTVLVVASSVQAQMGGGGIGSASLGLRTTGEALGIEAMPIGEAIPGRWRIEFRINRHSEDPRAQGVWRTVFADMSISGDRYVQGWIRDDDFPGDFSCSIDEYGRCMDGKFRFREDDQDWQVFSFILDRDGYRAEGWAVFSDQHTGAVREYELQMRKR